MTEYLKVLGVLTALVALSGCVMTDDMHTTDGTSADSRAQWPSQRTNERTTWNSMAFPTGDVRTSVIGIEHGSPKEVRVGQEYEYQIVVSNLTGHSVADVIVTENVNKDLMLVKIVPAAELTADGNTYWQLGDFKPYERRTIRVTGVTSVEGQIHSRSSVAYTPLLSVATPIVNPKLQLTKIAPSDANGCDEINYAFEVSNVGTGTINDVKITDSLPEGLKTTDGKSTIEIDAGALRGGETRKFTATVQAEKPGVYENQAQAAGDGLSAPSSLVRIIVHQPVVTVDITCPANSLVGRELPYTFTVNNAGDAPSAGTVLTANLPEGLVFVRAENGTFATGQATWNLGTIDVDDSRTVTAIARATSGGEMQATASVKGDCAPVQTDSCSISIDGAPDIGTSISDDTGVHFIAENHPFFYRVKNQGQIDLTDVTLVAELSDGLDFVSNTAPNEPKLDGKTVSWDLGTLKPGQEIAFAIVCKGTTAGEQKIKTTTKANELERSAVHDEQVTYVDR